MRFDSSIILGCILVIFSACNYENIQADNEFVPTCDPNLVLRTQAKYNIVLIVGQSNTHGGLGLNQITDKADGRIKQLGRFGDNNLKIIDAIEPLEHHTATSGKIGFGIAFANLFAKYFMELSDSLIIIPCGYGGTGFIDNQWNKNDPLYNDAVGRVNNVLQKYPESELKAILWHQGEKDIENTHYESMLDHFIFDIRADLGNPEVPFILGGMVPNWVDQEIARIKQQGIISSTKSRIDNVGYADPNTPSIIEKANNNFDSIHFNADGQREMGRRYFNEYICVVNKQP